jgi:hypothetical protein
MIEDASNATPDESFAVVTPTYLPDLRRCELLAESLDRCAPNVPHYLIVDRRDRSAFAHLERGKRRLLESEAILGSWMWRSPGEKGYWFSFKALPVRGWIIQQILKIGSVDLIPERTLVFCDSDTAFIRPFSRDNLLVDGKMGLLDVDFSTETTRQWTAVAHRLLGHCERSSDSRNFVGNMICWNKETVRAMRQKMEVTTGLSWQVALARTLNFSEYMLYGIFVRDIVGYQAVDHSPSAVPLVKPSWGMSLNTESEIQEFFSDFDDRTVAVMIHSKDDIEPARIRSAIHRAWKLSSGLDAST